MAWNKQYDIEKIEKVDEYLLKGILNTHSKSSSAGLYLELGCIPLRYVLKKRRIMYLHHILNRNSKELIRKVYEAQKRAPVSGDWVQLVESDLQELNIDIDELKKMKKNRFKKKLKEKILRSSFLYLKNIAQTKSKINYLSYKKLQVQKYLVSLKFNIKEKALLTKLRTRMIDVKNNSKNNYQNIMSCDLCGEFEDQKHLLNCKVLIENCEALFNDSIVEYEDIFGTEIKQLTAVRLYMKVLETREKLLKELLTRGNLVQCTT